MFRNQIIYKPPMDQPSQMMAVFSPAGVPIEGSSTITYEHTADVDQLARTAGMAYREHGVGGGKNTSR